MTGATDKAIERDHDVQLTSDRLLLRTLTLEDAEAIYAAVCESKAELVRWLPWCQGDYSINDTFEFLQGRAAAHAREREYAFAIVERDSGRFLGATGVNQYDSLARRVNLGYWLRTSATGRGYATEATEMVVHWAFEALSCGTH